LLPIFSMNSLLWFRTTKIQIQLEKI